MSTIAERQAMMAQIRDLPANIEATVQGLNNEQLDAPGGEGEWTIRQVVHHLADSHMNSFIRLKLILTEENPTLKPYDQEAWANLPDTASLPLEATFSILRGLHKRWVALFESLTEAQWQRTGFHPEIGDVTPGDLLKIYARHGEEHIEQITRLLTAQPLTELFAELSQSQQDFLDLLEQVDETKLYLGTGNDANPYFRGPSIFCR